MNDLARRIREICTLYGVTALYVYGSRASEIAERARGFDRTSRLPDSDIDLGVLVPRSVDFGLDGIIAFTGAVEDVFEVPRVDVVDLRRAPPYLSLDAIRGERLFAADEEAADLFELYVMRRAADLEPFERERRRMLLALESSEGAPA